MFHKHSRLQCLGHRHCKVVFSLGEPLPPPPLSTKVDIDVTHMINATRLWGGRGTWGRVPQFLHTVIDQILDGGKAWERSTTSLLTEHTLM